MGGKNYAPGMAQARQAHSAFVPDLSPQAHPERPWKKVRFVFVAESPHINEIAPEKVGDRRPLCGMAGRKWWGMLSELLEGDRSEDVSLERLLHLCSSRGIAVLNAVQYPLDPSIAKKAPHADPERVLGFSKKSGSLHYRRRKDGAEVATALRSLRERLAHPALSGAPVICLGNDAEWFVSRALGGDEFTRRVRCRLPHPAAWWRRGGHFGRVAREQLAGIFTPGRAGS